jgi:hypothetical protein
MHKCYAPILVLALSLGACATRHAAVAAAISPPIAPASAAYQANLTGL